MDIFDTSDAVLIWNGWGPVMRIVTVGTLTYFWILFLIRVSGQRTLATMKAFDLIITIAMGAAFGRVLTARDVPLIEAFTTFLLLVVLQTVLAWLQSRSAGFANLVSSDPVLLFHNGRFHEGVMKKQRIRKGELLSVVRKAKFSGLDQVEAIILESDGTFSVIEARAATDRSSLADLLDA